MFSFTATVYSWEPVDIDAMTEEEKAEFADSIFEYYKTVVGVIVSNYRFGITREEIYEQAVREALGTDEELLQRLIASSLDLLDRNSAYLPADEYDNLMRGLSDQIFGIGVLVSEMNGHMMVTGFPSGDSPARLAGIAVGDIIAEVDGTDVSDMGFYSVLPLILGEEGTSVSIGIQRRDIGELLYYEIIRRPIEQNFMVYEFEDDILYMHLSSFNDNCGERMGEVLREADRRKVKNVILDLRDNSGGLMDEALVVSSLFVPSGKTLSEISYKNEKFNITYKSVAAFTERKYDTVILVNERSASASEFVSAALRDNDVAVLIGDRTFGKGTQQQIIPLDPFDAAMRITVAQYLTPAGLPVTTSGLRPDIRVLNRHQKVNESELILPMTFERILEQGDSGDDVLACKQRLALLRYYVDDTGEYDRDTYEAVRIFQESSGLFPYGVLDKSTQIALSAAVADISLMVDDQLTAAKQYFKDGYKVPYDVQSQED